MMRKIPARFEHILFALLLSGLMSLLVSGVATWNAIGWSDGLGGKWLSAWVHSWLVAFPAVIVVAPLVRRIVVRCIQPGG